MCTGKSAGADIDPKRICFADMVDGLQAQIRRDSEAATVTQLAAFEDCKTNRVGCSVASDSMSHHQRSLSCKGGCC
jgi:hypothetical protein